MAAAARRGAAIVHYYRADDQATEASRQRRAATGPVPGNAAVLTVKGLETVDCMKARAMPLGPNMSLNHDYGRCDAYCLLDQREFVAGEPPEQRCLEAIVHRQSGGGGGGGDGDDGGDGGGVMWRLVTRK